MAILQTDRSKIFKINLKYQLRYQSQIDNFGKKKNKKVLKIESQTNKKTNAKLKTFGRLKVKNTATRLSFWLGDGQYFERH